MGEGTVRLAGAAEAAKLLGSTPRSSSTFRVRRRSPAQAPPSPDP
jgi:hypothetical protein